MQCWLGCASSHTGQRKEMFVWRDTIYFIPLEALRCAMCSLHFALLCIASLSAANLLVHVCGRSQIEHSCFNYYFPCIPRQNKSLCDVHHAQLLLSWVFTRCSIFSQSCSLFFCTLAVGIIVFSQLQEPSPNRKTRSF